MEFNKSLLKHFSRTHILGEDGYKQFALIALPDEMGDSCVTLVRCKENKVRHEMLYWGSFTEDDLKKIEDLQRGEIMFLSRKDLIVRLS